MPKPGKNDKRVEDIIVGTLASPKCAYCSKTFWLYKSSHPKVKQRIRCGSCWIATRDADYLSDARHDWRILDHTGIWVPCK